MIVLAIAFFVQGWKATWILNPPTSLQPDCFILDHITMIFPLISTYLENQVIC